VKTTEESTNTPVDADIEEKVKNFNELVQDVADLDPKLRLLWSEIYQNAVADRRYSRLLYEDLLPKLLSATENHGLYGDKIKMYLERMSKANDQLLLLVKYIAEHVVSDSVVNTKDLYSQFNK
jgi:hypothetical protein